MINSEERAVGVYDNTGEGCLDTWVNSASKAMRVGFGFHLDA